MKLTKYLFIFSILTLAPIAGPKEFKFNYKNLHALSALICESVNGATSQNSVLINKVSIDKNQYGPLPKDLRYEISGSCQNRVSSTGKEVLKYGEDLQLEMDLKNLGTVSGTLGIHKVRVLFKKKIPTKLMVDQYLLGEKKIYDLKNYKWSHSSSMVNFGKAEKLQLRSKKRIIASEENSNLVFSNGSIVYNIWSYESYSCRTKKKFGQKSCENLLQLLHEI